MSLPILGIDIAKDTYQVTLLVEPQRHRHSFPNQPDHFAELTAWLQQQGVTQVQACMEATGRYGEALATYLYAQQHTVSVVNPARIKAYARSQLRRNKTDQLDADVIAEFARTQAPPAWRPTAPEIRELQELVHEYDSLQAARHQEQNRLKSGVQSDGVRNLLTQQVAFLDTQLATVLQLIEDLINHHPDLKQRQDLLTSIPGIATLTAAKLQAMELQRFDNARAATAFVGLNPMQRDSGSSVHGRPRLSKIGHADLRRALYMPAVVAKRFNPLVRAFCERLAAKGKPTPAIIGAAMHKLLCLAYGVLKSGKPFDPNYAQIQPVTP
jgi:transposase